MKVLKPGQRVKQASMPQPHGATEGGSGGRRFFRVKGFIVFECIKDVSRIEILFHQVEQLGSLAKPIETGQHREWWPPSHPQPGIVRSHTNTARTTLGRATRGEVIRVVHDHVHHSPRVRQGEKFGIRILAASSRVLSGIRGGEGVSRVFVHLDRSSWSVGSLVVCSHHVKEAVVVFNSSSSCSPD